MHIFLEPLRFPKVFNKTLSGKSIGLDFNHLKSIITKIPLYSNSSIYGPDLTDFVPHSASASTQFLTEFLQQLNPTSLSAVTFHEYEHILYMNLFFYHDDYHLCIF